MFLARITFGPQGDNPSENDALKDTAESYLSSLMKNGQIYGDYLIAWSSAHLVGYTHVARPDSLSRRHHSDWSKSDLDVVVQAFGQVPTCDVIEDDVPVRFRSWKRSTSFYVFTHAFNELSPVRCGDTGQSIPLYLLPIPQQLREDLYFWARSYKYLDNIWLGSAALEIPAYKQLADPASDLSLKGRKLTADLERASKMPTFYYMQRYWGHIQHEAERLCPVCGGKWHLSEIQRVDRPFHQFDFRCQRCRLVSHNAVSYEDKRHARIGEFKQSK